MPRRQSGALVIVHGHDRSFGVAADGEVSCRLKTGAEADFLAQV